jgi:RNA polymerase sigma-70 factor (ECF subfamily)
MQADGGVDVLNAEAQGNPVSERVRREAAGADADEQLMAAFARGSAEAFNELFRRYRQPVFGFFCRRVEDRAQAEELAQETFVAVLRAGGRWEAAALFRTYLYAIALRILRAHRRKMAFRGMFWGTRKENDEPATVGDFGVGLAVREAVGKLDGMDREVLMLREFEELSYLEIAEVLGIPVNTVRSRLFRARTALRELLVARGTKTNAGELKKVEEHA